MKIVLKLLIGALTAIGAIAACLFIIFFLYKSGYLGHSDFYRSLDTDFDDKLSYREWMKYYSLPMHKHPIERCMRVDFYLADCDQDDALTWREYHDFRFRNKRCVSSAVPTLRQWLESNPEFKGVTKINSYALSTPNMEGAQSEAYRKYIATLVARENELRKNYGIE